MYGVTGVSVTLGYASPPPPSPPPPPPGAAASLALTPGPWALAASPATDAATGVARVTYVSAASLSGTWRTNRPASIAVTATFSAAVSGFTAASIAVSGGGSVYNFTSAGDGATYYFGVSPTSTTTTSTLTVSVAAGAAVTAAGGPTLAASLSVVYDPSPPAPVIASNATKGSTSALYIAFAINYGKVRRATERLSGRSG